jgi:hypothetical protein
MTMTDREMQGWIDEWQATEVPGAPPAEIRSYVRRRSRLLALWIAAEVTIGVGGLLFVLYFMFTVSGGVHQLAMALLAAIVVAVLAFDSWNWRGTLSASAEDTTTFLTLSMERLRRVRRALRVSWLLIAAQVAVFTPWVWYRLYARPEAATARQQGFAWGLLIGMSVGAAVWTVLVDRWATRDARVLDALAKELGEEAIR